MKKYLVKASLFAFLAFAPISIVLAEDTQASDIMVEAVDAKVDAETEVQNQVQSDDGLMIVDEGEDSSVVSVISDVDEDGNNDDDSDEDDALYLQALKNTEPVETYFYSKWIYVSGMPNPVAKSWQVNTYRKEDLLKNYLLVKQEAEKAKKLAKEEVVEPVIADAVPTEHVEEVVAKPATELAV